MYMKIYFVSYKVQYNRLAQLIISILEGVIDVQEG